jgi:hypothetical protein
MNQSSENCNILMYFKSWNFPKTFLPWANPRLFVWKFWKILFLITCESQWCPHFFGDFDVSTKWLLKLPCGIIMVKKTHTKLILCCYTCSRIISHVIIQIDLCWTKIGYIICIPLTSIDDNIPRFHHKIGYETISQMLVSNAISKAIKKSVPTHMF